MKKALLFFMSLSFIGIVYAGNHTVVVKGTTPIEDGNTEVLVQQDSIIVTPNVDATTIVVELVDNEGEIVSQQVVPASVNSVVNVNTTNSPSGCILKIRDDDGVVFEEQQMFH